MSKLIREIGANIVKDQENLKNPKQFVQAVLDTRSKFNHIVQVAFKQDRTFARALKEALEYFINLDSRSAQYLSLHIDDMFRKSLKDIPTAELDKRLNNVISIFRYLQDKDVFEDFYKKHLAARLLTAQSKDVDIEKKMIAELKGECGHQYTARLEGMFKDMDLSKTIMKHFKAFRAKAGRTGGTDISVTVLTSGFWPIPGIVVPKCILPKPAQQITDEFTGYYFQKYSGRRLTWQTNLGTAEVRATFEKGKKELLLHTYQMCIIMLYNNSLTLTYEEIKKATNITDQELERHLLSLAHPKVRLLKKTPNNKNIAPDHTFTYNLQYTSKLKRVKIPLLSAKQSSSLPLISPLSPVKPVPDSISETRKSRVEATIVRLMKERKTLEHNTLVEEVTNQLASRFPVEASFVRKRIESLIEREYLERDKQNSRVYHYVA